MSHHDVDPSVDQIGDPIGALRAELSRVEVSPEFAERVRRQIGEDVMGSVGAELSAVSVSPQFAVRVRQQIDNAPSRSRVFGWLNWRWAVPVAAAAAIAAFTLTRGATPTTGGVDPAAVQVRVPDQGAGVSQAPQAPSITSTVPAMPNATVSQASRTATTRANERTATAVAASGQQADDKLEVITDQPAILRQLWAAVTTVEVTEARPEASEIVVVPVEVRPVAVQWLVEPPQSGGVAPIIRRVSADAVRSDK